MARKKVAAQIRPRTSQQNGCFALQKIAIRNRRQESRRGPIRDHTLFSASRRLIFSPPVLFLSANFSGCLTGYSSFNKWLKVKEGKKLEADWDSPNSFHFILSQHVPPGTHSRRGIPNFPRRLKKREKEEGEEVLRRRLLPLLLPGADVARGKRLFPCRL
jgi:hypothetical protein